MNNGWNCIVQHDAVKKFPLEDNSIDVCITSPPYWGLRNYGEQVKSIFGGDPNCKHVFAEYHSKLAHENRQNLDGGTVGNDKFREKLHGFGNAKAGFCSKCGAWQGQLGLEPTPNLYIDHLVQICCEIKRVLKKSGSFYLNLGDTYSSKLVGRFTGGGKEFTGRNMTGIATSGSIDKTKSGIPQKSLCLIPSRVAIALVDNGWILRNAIIWHKPNPMPSSVKDRLNTTYEFVFHFVKSRKYYYDLDAIRIPWGDKRKADIKRALEKHPGYDGKYADGYNADYRDLIGGQGIKGQPVGNPKLGKNPGDVLEYNSKYKNGIHGQTPQGFIRDQSIAKGRAQSREDAKILFPNDPKKQQEYINFIHDSGGDPRGRNPGDVIWNKKEFEELNELYPYCHNYNIADYLGRTKRAVEGQAYRVGLKKNKGYLRYTYNRKYILDDTFFDIINSEEKAYWFGFLWGDGYINVKKGRLVLALQEVQKCKSAKNVWKNILPTVGMINLKEW